MRVARTRSPPWLAVRDASSASSALSLRRQSASVHICSSIGATGDEGLPADAIDAELPVGLTLDQARVEKTLSWSETAPKVTSGIAGSPRLSAHDPTATAGSRGVEEKRHGEVQIHASDY